MDRSPASSVHLLPMMESTTGLSVVNGALPLNAGTDPAAASEPKRTRETRTRGKKKPHPPRHLSVEFRSTGFSSLGRPTQAAPTPYRPSHQKCRNDDINGDGRETKKARHAEIETKVDGLTKELEEMKALLARSEEKKRARESRHADSESLTQNATEVKGLRKEIEELKDLFVRNLYEMEKSKESRHADTESSSKDGTIAESTGDGKRIKKEDIS